MRIGAVGVGLGYGPRVNRSQRQAQQQGHANGSTATTARTPFAFHGVVDLGYGIHCCLESLVHIARDVAWGVALILTFVESLDEAVDYRLSHATLRQTLVDVLAREILHAYVQFVAHIAPQGTQHLVVECTRLPSRHEFCRHAQTLCGHSVGLFATLLHQVGVVDGTAAEHHKQRDEHHNQHCEPHPIHQRGEEEAVTPLLLHFAKLDVAYVLIELLHIRLPCVVSHGTAADPLGHVEGEALCAHCLIGVGVCVVVDELHGRYLILSGMTRHGHDIIYHVALNAIGCQFGLVGHFRTVCVEVLGEVYRRLLYQLQVATSTHHHAQVYRVVGLHARLVELGGNAELPHSTREARRTCWQRVNLYCKAWSLYLLLHLDISRPSVEERLKGVDVAILLHDDAVECYAWYLKFARYLREHHILAPCNRPVRTPIVILHLEALLLRQLYLLGVKSLQVGHLTVELGQIDKRVYLICEQYRLLFMHTLLVGANLDEKVCARYARPCGTHLLLAALLAASVAAAAGRSAHVYLQCVGSHRLAPNRYARGRNGERAALVGAQYKGVCYGRRRAGVAVDNLETRLPRLARSHEHLKGVGHTGSLEAIHVLRGNGVCEPELLAHRHLRRGLAHQPLGETRQTPRQQKDDKSI